MRWATRVPGRLRAYSFSAVSQKLRTLSARFPPDHVLLDSVELGESACHALFRAQHLVDVLDELHDPHALVLDLVGRTEDVGVVELHAPHAAQPAQLA